eukprot:CAMPEP_0198146788 /NCGR_PEP_ID=MMETSP1443-20131203/31409_1 /TAXON_ID=186043 /ORGANISM="Entomoneis sp., Strain CCMP2396" /LENGTH=137 /DNA_ID=CAMNT_0043810865 /DNA_START=55 /DNA_END=468 /DNA_ORIENTATION=-
MSNTAARNNLFHGSPSYQTAGAAGASASAGGSYQPPVHYAKDQTKSLEDTTRIFHQADETATKVLSTMTHQRNQIEGAHEDVHDMRHAMKKAKEELMELQQKYRLRKQKLYVTIFLLGLTDFLLLVRLLQCHGSFFC